MNQNDGQNKLGNNNPNQGVPNNQNGSSFNVPKHDAPHVAHSNGSFQDSLNRKPVRMDNDSPSSTLNRMKDAAKNKMIDAIPGGRQIKNAMDMGKRANNALQNIRAKKGPQLPPNRSKDNADTGSGNSNSKPSSDLDNNNDSMSNKAPSFLPKKPKFLDNDDDNENEDQDTSENQGGLSALRGRNRKSNGDSLSYLASGFLKMAPITKLVLIVAISLFPLIIFFTALSPLLIFNSTSPIGIADNNESYKTTEEEKNFKNVFKKLKMNIAKMVKVLKLSI